MLQARWIYVVAAALLVANAGCGKSPKGEANGSVTSGSGQASGSNDGAGGDAGGASGTKSMSAGAGGAVGAGSDAGTRPGKGEVNEGILHTSEGWVLTEDDNGKFLTLHPGERVFVRVGASQTNGYKWDVAGNWHGVLKQVGQSMFAPGTSSSKTDGTQTWKYEAATKGEGTVEMNYLPPFSKSVPERVLRFTVSVK
jgi:predicted secreted protein